MTLKEHWKYIKEDTKQFLKELFCFHRSYDWKNATLTKVPCSKCGKYFNY